MLLKITEKIIQDNAFEQKNPGLAIFQLWFDPSPYPRSQVLRSARS